MHIIYGCINNQVCMHQVGRVEMIRCPYEFLLVPFVMEPYYFFGASKINIAKQPTTLQ